MFSMYRTLSARYLRQRWTRAVLIVASIALGVATLVATRSLNDTMNKAVRAAANPLAGNADLMVSNGDLLISRALEDRLARVRGVRAVRALVLETVAIKELKGRSVLLVGIDIWTISDDNPWGVKPNFWNRPRAVWEFLQGKKVCLLGEELSAELAKHGHNPEAPVRLTAKGGTRTTPVTQVGTLAAEGQAAALAGNVVAMHIDHAIAVLGREPGMVNRIDLILEPGYDREQVRERVREVLNRQHVRAEVRTPEEQAQVSGRVMEGLQSGFALCGIGALVVGMFLVYNALSVSVAERRHEIGILRSLGATRLQVRTLFAGEAAMLGLAGAAFGIPLGLGLAYLALEPMKEVVSEIFRAMDANRVEWTVATLAIAVGAGIVTALLASLVPAFQASAEEPAVAVRRVPLNPTWKYRFLQMAVSGLLMFTGVVFILARRDLEALGDSLGMDFKRLGTYGGLVLVLLGALLATPLLAAVAARLVQPLARRFLGIEGRLAADNLVRSPARTGLVIAALAAGVALVMQTAGTIQSNRDAVLDWVQKYIAADVVVTAGSPVSPGGQGQLMPELLGPRMKELFPDDIRAALPVRFRYHTFAGTTVFVTALDADKFYEADKDHTPEVPGLDLYREMSHRPGTVLISDNFAALHHIRPGDKFKLAGVPLEVLGTVVDYSWNHGTVIMDWGDYARKFHDNNSQVNVFDVYLKKGRDAAVVRDAIARKFSEEGLVVKTHQELQEYIIDVLERLYAIAYGQQIIVGLVASLGVVTALLIAVLQRRRELGVLRAIGATRAQVLRSVLAEAALMGVIGTAIGLVVGVPMEWYVLQVLILQESGYFFPVTVPWAASGIIAGTALLVATLAGVWPALHAVRLRIPEAIAHE
jgi:putative ABC transport system permease protein